MKIHEYNEMMRWLTRPAGPDPRSMPQEPRIADREPYYMGGRVGFGKGSGYTLDELYPKLEKRAIALLNKGLAPIDVSSPKSTDISPQGILAKNLNDKLSISSFEGFKDWLRALYKDGQYDGDAEQVKSWNSFKDIPAKECRKLLKLL